MTISLAVGKFAYEISRSSIQTTTAPREARFRKFCEPGQWNRELLFRLAPTMEI
jgi:hypothetical protein